MSGETAAAPTIAEQRDALLDHFRLCVALHGEAGGSRMMRKFGIRFSVHHDDAETVRKAFIRVKSAADWQAVLDRWYLTPQS
jgi:tRNA-dihydrouridine synthase